MHLKEFVQEAISEIVGAVDQAGRSATRNIHLTSTDQNRTIEFDIAVAVEETSSTTGKAGIKVLQFVEAGGNLSSEVKNSTVSRVRFGVRVANVTKEAERGVVASVNPRNQYNI